MVKNIELHEPLISIIIPCYNGESFIRDSIESVIGQSHKNWELMVVDDGSKDGSRDVVGEYINDKRITLIVNKHNIGIPQTKNRGLSRAKGEYIAFLDQDDIWMPSKLELQLGLFENEGEAVGIVCTGMLFMNSAMRYERIFKGFDDTSQEDLLKNLYLYPINSSSIMMTKREVIARVGVFDENLVGWDDYELLMRIATRFQLKYVRELLVKKRVHTDSVQRTKAVRDETEKVFDQVLIYHPFLRRYQYIKDSLKFYSDSLILLETGTKVLARKKLRRSMIENPRLFKVKFLYILSFLPGKSSLKIKSMISFLINLLKVEINRLMRAH
jgi:teichuronic acid biosynthesis glycosyltransferase TuaG